MRASLPRRARKIPARAGWFSPVTEIRLRV
jgi:hypothetical protein